MSERNFKTREGYDIWDKLCAIPKYGFLIGPSGGVVKMLDIGNWIDRDEAQRVVDEAQSEVNLLREERDQLRAELAEYRVDPSYSAACETIRTLRAELDAIRGQQSATALELRKASSWICREVEAGTTSATHWAIRLRERADQIESGKPQQPDAVSVSELLDALQNIYSEVEGNIEPTVRDLVNQCGRNTPTDPNEIYEYCARIKAVIVEATRQAEEDQPCAK